MEVTEPEIADKMEELMERLVAAVEVAEFRLWLGDFYLFVRRHSNPDKHWHLERLLKSADRYPRWRGIEAAVTAGKRVGN